MKKYLLPETGNFYKANLHVHTTISDGALSPEEITSTEVRREGEKFIVEGQWLFDFMSRINFYDHESLNYFQRVLIKNGVIEKLREAGVEEGDTVNIYDYEFDFVY